MNDLYSPHTGEHIATDTPAEWMGRAGINAPSYTPGVESAFWRGTAWEVVGASPYVAPVPREVTMRQARTALLQAGQIAAVNGAIASMAGVEGDAARIEWEYSQTVERNRELVAAMGQILGLDDAQLDALFIAAAKL